MATGAARCSTRWWPRISARTVAVAESLTGGLLTAALTEPAGASNAVRGGLVVYATDLKATLAGVPVPLLARARARSARTSPARWRPAPGTGSAPRTGWP